jgi:hypothetical protein
VYANEKKPVPLVAVLAGSRGPRNTRLARGADNSRHRRRFRLDLLPCVILAHNLVFGALGTENRSTRGFHRQRV